MSGRDDDDGDAVGYGRPPKATRFVKGQSGNPAGRRKGSKNLSTLVQTALGERVTINVGGRKKTVSKIEAAFLQQANEAAKGNAKATKLMVDLLVGAQGREAAQGGGETAPQEKRQRHELVLAALKARFADAEDDDDDAD